MAVTADQILVAFLVAELRFALADVGRNAVVARPFRVVIIASAPPAVVRCKERVHQVRI